jgi:serine/threonine-protein kinase
MIRLGLGDDAPLMSFSGEELPAKRHSPESIARLAAQLQSMIGERFRVLEPVAIGGMATLFQVQHRLHRGLFIAKVLHLELVERRDVRESFRREAIHLAQLGNHPAMIPILDFQENDSFAFFLTPFIEGEDLDHTLARCGSLSRTEALHMAAQISSLLCHAESHGITHCDLAPGNIRLDTFGRYRVLDFGLSRSRFDTTTEYLSGGTPVYTSPEQAGGGQPDHRSDLYSLALILCEAMSGRALISGDSFEEIRHKHLAAQWAFPAVIQKDPPVAKLLDWMLAANPAKRMQSAFELSGVLAALGFERPEFHGMSKIETENRRVRLSS